MGHLTNPIALRLSINTTWNSNWSLNNNFNYNNIFKRDYLLFQFLDSFAVKKQLIFRNVIISHYKVFRTHKAIFINLYYYSPDFDELRTKLYSYPILRAVWMRYKATVLIPQYKRKKVNTKIQYPSGFKEARHLNYKLYVKRINKMCRFIFKHYLVYSFWYLINKNFNYYLNKINKNNNNKVEYYYLNVFRLAFYNVNVNIVALYISYRLQQRYSLNWVLRPVFKDLAKRIEKGQLAGYKILCSGRFTRKQIATYIWSKKGSLGLNTFTSLVKYAQSKVRLKFGIGGIKVWLNYGIPKNKKNRIINFINVYPLYNIFRYIFYFKAGKLVILLNYWAYSYLKLIFFKNKVRELSSSFIYILFVKIKIVAIIKYIIKRMKVKKTINNFKFYQLNYYKNNKFVIIFKPFFIQNRVIKISNLKLFKKFY
jgi:ribosomal protein S3